MKTQLSIIIVNYNTGELLKECVQSIEETTNDFQNPSCEVVVIDNASIDGSVEELKNGRTEKLKIIQNANNLGFAKAVNQGIKKVRGKYILLLNPDTKVQKGAIQKLLSFAESTDDAGIVGTKLILEDGTTQKSVFHSPTIWRAVQEFWFGKKTYSSYVPRTSTPVVVDAVVGAAFLITPRALQTAGMLSERYFMYFEDLDYCRRVKKAGLKVYYLPEAEIVHHHGVSGKSVMPDKEQWKRLIPSSKLYHGLLKHHLINFIIWSGQKWQKLWHKS